MIKLTPLEETVAGQELIQRGEKRGMLKGLEKGRREGHRDGVAKGELIGRIHATQRFLKRPLTLKKRLMGKKLSELKMVRKQLESELRT